MAESPASVQTRPAGDFHHLSPRRVLTSQDPRRLRSTPVVVGWLRLNLNHKSLIIAMEGGSSPCGSVIKKLPAEAGDPGDACSVPGSGRPPGGGHGNPLQCSCLDSPMDRGAWWATVHGVLESQTQWKRLSTHTCVEQEKTPAMQSMCVCAQASHFHHAQLFATP